jgi:hypothetical protein
MTVSRALRYTTGLEHPDLSVYGACDRWRHEAEGREPTMSEPTRLEKRIQHDFPAPGAANGIITALDRLPDEAGYDPETFRSERIRAAIVLLADGDLSRFRNAVELAKTDWRDLLVAAGLAHEDWPARLDEALNT